MPSTNHKHALLFFEIVWYMSIEFIVGMNLVSLSSNFSPQLLLDLARVCVWLEWVPPSLIGIFSVAVCSPHSLI